MASNLCALNKFTVLKIEEYTKDNSNLSDIPVFSLYMASVAFAKYFK